MNIVTQMLLEACGGIVIGALLAVALICFSEMYRLLK